MAGAGIKEIKNRIGSVQSTKQVTKAMELVSSSKMRKAKDRALASRPYFNTMYETVKDIASNTRGVRDPFLKQREVKNKCYIVIAGDRGLAGGYNSNIFKLTTAHMDGKQEKVMTVGKKATEFFQKRGYDILAAEESVEALNMIDVVFYSSKGVREAWNAFNDATNLPDSNAKLQTISDKHLRLLEVIAKDIGYKDIHWDNIKQYYYPIGLSTKKQDETVLRRVQIDAALAQIKEGQEHKEAAQTDTQTTLNNQMLLKVLENPDSFIKLIDAAEKAQNLGKSTRQKR